MLDSRTLHRNDQADAMGRLDRLRDRAARLDAEMADGVAAARDAYLPEWCIADVLGVHRNTLTNRYGPVERDGGRGRRLVEQERHLQVFEVPAQRSGLRPVTS